MSSDGRLADFGAFYERTYLTAFRVAYGIVGERDGADDVTQEAFTTAYRERHRYRGDGPTEVWLYRIVVNTALATLRRRRVRRVVPLDPLVPLAKREPVRCALARHLIGRRGARRGQGPPSLVPVPQGRAPGAAPVRVQLASLGGDRRGEVEPWRIRGWS